MFLITGSTVISSLSFASFFASVVLPELSAPSQIIICSSPFGKVPVKNEGRQGFPSGLHRLLPLNEKTTGALIEPARGFSSSIDSRSSTDLTPVRQAKKAAEPKVTICKQPTLRFHSDATLIKFCEASW